VSACQVQKRNEKKSGSGKEERRKRTNEKSVLAKVSVTVRTCRCHEVASAFTPRSTLSFSPIYILLVKLDVPLLVSVFSRILSLIRSISCIFKLLTLFFTKDRISKILLYFFFAWNYINHNNKYKIYFKIKKVSVIYYNIKISWHINKRRKIEILIPQVECFFAWSKVSKIATVNSFFHFIVPRQHSERLAEHFRQLSRFIETAATVSRGWKGGLDSSSR